MGQTNLKWFDPFSFYTPNYDILLAELNSSAT